MKEELILRRALLVDDDPLMGKLVSYGLSSAGIECTHLTTYEQAVSYLDRQLLIGSKGQAGSKGQEHDMPPIDVVILDYYLNDGKTGLPLCKKLRQRFDLPVIMLTGEKSLETTIKCLEEGADQYMCKPFDLDELIARLKASIRARKSRQLQQVVTVQSGLTIKVSERELQFGSVVVSLTEKESLLAEVLSRNVGYPVSKEELFEQVYGRYAGIHSRCLDMLVGRLRKKLENAGCNTRILSARNMGYKLVVKQNV